MMIERFKLKNGIPVFVVENHASPVVSVQAWVSRGSVYEGKEVAGISHFLEHALFKGTKKRKVGEIALEIERRGGEVNAFTSFEETCYYATLASRYFADGLDIISDAIQSPLFDKEEMAREREVILEEIKRAQDSPHKVLSQNLWNAAFEKTPYGRPVLGFVDTVKKIDHKKLKEYFTKHYHAGSVSLFIVGDVKKEQARELAEKMLGKMKKGKQTAIPYKKALPSKNVKVVSSGRDVQECHVQIAWTAPSINHATIPPLDLMCTAIGQGESSRLYQRLVKEKKVALEAHMGLAATANCGLSTLSLETAPEHLEEAIGEAVKLLEEVALDGILEREVERVKSSLEADVIGGKETVEGYARRLGYYFVQFGDPEFEKKYLESVLSTTRDDATDALWQMLLQKPVVSIVHPKDYKVDEKKIAELLSKKRENKPKISEEINLPSLKKSEGIRFIEKQLTSLPIVAVRILFPGGSREEASNQQGLGNLYQRLWTSGTKSYSSLHIAHTLESLGASVSSFCGKHTMGISVEFLTKQWPLVKPLLSEVLLNPTFPKEELETERSLLLRDILAEKDSPGNVCHLNLVRALYGNHPYGRSSLGKKEDVEKVSQGDLLNFYRRFIHQGNVVISTVGNFDPEMWEDELSSLISQLPKTGDNPKPFMGIEEPKEMKIEIATKQPLFQSHLLIGFLSAGFKDSERYALKVLSSALSGQGGRLFLELRDKQSLAYSVSPISADTPERGMFGFYIGCGPEKLMTSIAGIRNEIDKILEKPLGAKELARAKEYWIGRFELDMQRYGAQAMLFGLDEVYGLGYSHFLKVPEMIKSITAEDIQKAALKYLQLDRAVFSIVHNETLDPQKVRDAWGA